MIEGGCFCGAVRYRIEPGDYPAVHCHCTMCRRTSGAPFVSWLVVPLDRFNYTGREPRRLQSSAQGERFFCPDCGTPVTCRVASQPEHIDVTIGSLDEPGRHAPHGEVHADTKLPWITTRVPSLDG